jgi:leucyl/phenylalanyl-tRNA--protein transferase
VDDSRDLIGYSRSVSADMMLEGYRVGLFPMAQRPGLYTWWRPDPRGVLPLDNLRVTRSLRKSMSRYCVTTDTDFEALLDRCADPARPAGWIDAGLARAYRDLASRGVAHSVEARDGDGRLVGGLFGVNLGGLFTGESMFHQTRDASKTALVALVERLRRTGRPVLLDTQWLTDHLASLGAVEIPLSEYMTRLEEVVNRDPVWTPDR